MTHILAIETSCDETSAAVVQDGRLVLSNVVASQVDLHAQYGGVFPELASRLHVEAIVPIITQALEIAHVGWSGLDAIAATHGPGLAGSLVVGVNAAKGIALGRNLPLIGINHLEGHIYAHWLNAQGDGMPTGELEFPLLFLIVSGGHTELIIMRGHGQYELVGQTCDDAAGEAFDKVARLLNLGYPGGPAIEQAAQQGSPAAYHFSKPKVDNPFDFSFSGIKTAVLRLIQSKGEIRSSGKLPYGVRVNDLAASFQAGVVDQLARRTTEAAQEYNVKAVLLSGGVSANRALRTAVKTSCAVPVYWLPLWLCTDNAAMIGAAAYWRFMAGERASWDMDVEPGLRLVQGSG
jgi:N6-L-threonylcarbamoyladenine synthase